MLVRQRPDLCDGEDLAGDVACAGDRDDADGTVTVLERAAQVREQLLGRLRRVEQVDASDASPGEHVGVVLDDGAQHGVTGTEHQAVGEEVDGLRRVPDEDDCIG